MRAIFLIFTLITTFFLSACAQKNSNPVDPYENINRKVHAFNTVVDNFVLRPPAVFYVTLVPAPVRISVNNFFNNVYMIPTVANDVLQADLRYALKDTWRFFINTTFGIGGLFDVATHFGLPPHSNDLGLTFARWGDTKSPFLILPIFGPSTIRDASGMGIQFALFTPYSWVMGGADTMMYGLMGLSYLDIRSNYFDAEKLMKEALDEYSFMRDAWLQHREYQITGVENRPAVDLVSGTGDAVAAFDDYVEE